MKETHRSLGQSVSYVVTKNITMTYPILIRSDDSEKGQFRGVFTPSIQNHTRQVAMFLLNHLNIII